MIQYKVYRVTQQAWSINAQNLSMLIEIDFKGWQMNRFDTMEEALEIIKKDKISYTDLVILPYVYLTT